MHLTMRKKNISWNDEELPTVKIWVEICYLIKRIYHTVLKFVKIILWLSVTNAPTEHVFSAMREHGHVKKYCKQISTLKAIFYVNANFQDILM